MLAAIKDPEDQPFESSRLQPPILRPSQEFYANREFHPRAFQRTKSGKTSFPHLAGCPYAAGYQSGQQCKDDHRRRGEVAAGAVAPYRDVAQPPHALKIAPLCQDFRFPAPAQTPPLQEPPVPKAAPFCEGAQVSAPLQSPPPRNEDYPGPAIMHCQTVGAGIQDGNQPSMRKRPMTNSRQPQEQQPAPQQQLRPPPPPTQQHCPPTSPRTQFLPPYTQGY